MKKVLSNKKTILAPKKAIKTIKKLSKKVESTKVTPEVVAPFKMKLVKKDNRGFCLTPKRIKLFKLLAHNTSFTFDRIHKGMKLSENAVRYTLLTLTHDGYVGVKITKVKTKRNGKKLMHNINNYFITDKGFKTLMNIYQDIEKIIE